jgi:hypothetical protein
VWQASPPSNVCFAKEAILGSETEFATAKAVEMAKDVSIKSRTMSYDCREKKCCAYASIMPQKPTYSGKEELEEC